MRRLSLKSTLFGVDPKDLTISQKNIKSGALPVINGPKKILLNPGNHPVIRAPAPSQKNGALRRRKQSLKTERMRFELTVGI